MILLLCLILGFAENVWSKATYPIQVPESLKQRLKSFEASAVLSLEDSDSYLIASDDTDKKDSPYLFVMDSSGKIDADPVLINGINKMTDMESISQDSENKLYVLSSQSVNKNGKIKKERNIFIQADRVGKSISVNSQLELRPITLKALKKSEEPILKGIREKFEKELDIESHLIREGNLILGLKNPQINPGQALLIGLGPIDDLFAPKKIPEIRDITLINFHAISGEEDLLSDILSLNGFMYMTTTTEVGSGKLWRYSERSQKLELVKEFPGLRPEGLTYRREQNDLMIVFDQGKDSSRFSFFKL